uniref:TNFR-Cys domain-containing protein n=1 Tax=Gadus morhua TaxID=8049 RepID=A0A8C5BNH5_GADMO
MIKQYNLFRCDKKKKTTRLNWTTMFFRLMLFCSVYINYVGLTLPYPAYAECGEQSYIVGDLCCPKCPPGKKISEDCKKNRATICTICTNGTFQEGLNQQRHCVSNCTKCDEGLGLKVKKSCSSTSDAVCEVLDGFFCSDSNRSGCRAAQSHRLSCSPGHYIGQRGWCCIYCTDTLIINKLLNKLTSTEPIQSHKGHPGSYHLMY